MTPERATPPNVFISYKSQDDSRNEWVERFCCDLRIKHGVDALLDTFEVDYGASFGDYMTSKIDRDCEAMLFVITPAAVEAVDQARAGGVHFEMQVASARRIREPEFRIIGIYREGDENSSYLKDHRYIDFRDDSRYDSQLGELARSLWGESRRPPLALRLFTQELELPVEIAAEVLRLRSESVGVRLAAAHALGEAGNRLAVPYMMGVAEDEAPDVRCAAIRALGAMKAHEVVPDLKALLADDHMDVRVAAIDALGAIGGSAARDAVIAALNSADDEVQDRARLILDDELGAACADVHAAFATEVLGARAEIGMLERKAALNALRLIGGEPAVKAIEEVLWDDHPTMAVEAAIALGDIGGAAAVGSLLSALHHRSPHVRAAACGALGTLRARAAVDALIARAIGDSTPVRIAAIGALGYIGGETAARALSRLQKDPDPQVAIAAAKALAYAWPRL